MEHEQQSGDRGKDVQELLDVIARLRGEEGCPWDRKQTLESLKPYLIEECYELIEAIEDGDIDAHRDELGDVLLQVLLQSRIREEEQAFDFNAVAVHLSRKLIRRHPHVFADVTADTPEAVVENWERIKCEERAGAPQPVATLDGVPRHLPALQRAQRIQARAARVGFDWDHVDAVFCKVEEELDEVREAMDAGQPERVEEELGDLFFATVNLCRFKKVNAEEALTGAIRKFSDRFYEVERRLKAMGQAMETSTLEAMDQVWKQVKGDKAKGMPDATV